jgi:hypothetical protein
MEGLRTVWKNCANKAKRRCRMVMRFGAINDRKVTTGNDYGFAGRHWLALADLPTGWLGLCGPTPSGLVCERQGALEEYNFWAGLVE